MRFEVAKEIGLGFNDKVEKLIKWRTHLNHTPLELNGKLASITELKHKSSRLQNHFVQWPTYYNIMR